MNITTSEGRVQQWFEDLQILNDLMFFHLTMRTTLGGQYNSYKHFIYCPDESYKNYVTEAEEHFNNHNSLVNRKEFDFFHSRDSILGQRKSNPDQKLDMKLRKSESAFFIHKGHIFDKKNHRGIETEEETKSRRKKYYTILENIYPALMNRDIDAVAYSHCFSENAEDKSIEDGFGFAFYLVLDGTISEERPIATDLAIKIVLEITKQMIDSSKCSN